MVSSSKSKTLQDDLQLWFIWTEYLRQVQNKYAMWFGKSSADDLNLSLSPPVFLTMGIDPYLIAIICICMILSWETIASMPEAYDVCTGYLSKATRLEDWWDDQHVRGSIDQVWKSLIIFQYQSSMLMSFKMITDFFKLPLKNENSHYQ